MPLKDYQKRTVVEYVWQDANGNFRSKTKIFPTVCWEDTLETTPLWHFDGSSTGQADAGNSEVILKPWFKCMDPFRYLVNKGNMFSQLVFCDLWVPKKDNEGNVVTSNGLVNSMDGVKTSVEEEVANYLHPTDLDAREKKVDSVLTEVNGVHMELEPHRDNTRERARRLFEESSVKESDPWFGFEQEFFFTDLKTGKVVGWDVLNMVSKPKEQGDYYCGVGLCDEVARVKKVADEVLNDIIVIRGHLNCTGYNLEVAPGQCEFQIRGSGLDAADNLTVFRYVLTRRAADHGLGVNFHPKPLKYGDWNGSGCHMNFSTKAMREKDGYDKILRAVDLLRQNHKEHMEVYGKDNELRMTGECETAKYDVFSWGVADRTASVRIPRNVHVEKCGYLEDRRPASNCDPYLVSSRMVETVIMSEKVSSEKVSSEKVVESEV